ncbi:LPXTG cell wall anchor domain-containing protein [Bacillus sp. S3]|nr:LPXTG cell wall anchor domain-containing protein [Bacillus sp. S3]QCJ40816.1 LPXTG cell wall anchor domain-containing protein [Bacillus sp. S3]
MSKWGKTVAGLALIGAGIGFLFRKRKGGEEV